MRRKRAQTDLEFSFWFSVVLQTYLFAGLVSTAEMEAATYGWLHIAVSSLQLTSSRPPTNFFSFFFFWFSLLRPLLTAPFSQLELVVDSMLKRFYFNLGVPNYFTLTTIENRKLGSFLRKVADPWHTRRTLIHTYTLAYRRTPNNLHRMQ